MKKIVFLLVIIASTLLSKAQVFMVCNPSGSSCTPYDNINNAITQANSGDYIYLPGGVHVLSAIIDKPLHIIGAGFNVDSSVTTDNSVINGNLILTTNASTSHFEGFEVTGQLAIQNTTDTIKKCVFVKVKINGAVSVNFIKCNFYQSVFQSTLSNGSSSNEITGAFYNCIFSSRVHSWYNSTFANSMFLPSGGSAFWGCNAAIVKNNIFYNHVSTLNFYEYNYYGAANGNMSASNNFIIGGYTWGYSTLIVDQNNNVSTACADHFANCPSSPYQTSFNFHLLSTSPAKISGNDGTDVGIYGGAMPWTDGSVPGNPHIYFKNISSSTNSNNNLPVNIKVRSGN